MLHIMSLTYQQDVESNDVKIEQFDSVQDQRTHLFDSYIEHMFKRKGKRGPSYSKEEGKRWLSLLAKNRSPRPQEIFFIEEMQPAEWLNNGQQTALAVGVRLAGCLTWVLIAIPFFGLPIALLFELPSDQTAPVADTLFKVALTLIAGPFIGVILGSMWVVFDWIGVRIAQQVDKLQQWYVKRVRRRWSDGTWKILSLFAVTVICGLVGGVLGWFIGLFTGQTWFLFFSVIGGFSSGFAVMREQRIVVIERFIWSRSKMISGGLFGLVLGLVLGIVGSLILSEDLLTGLVFGMGLGAALGVIGGLMLGLTAGEEEQEVKLKKRTTPNQGIWQTARIGLLAGLTMSLGPIVLLELGMGLFLFLYGVPFSGIGDIVVATLPLFTWLAVMLGVMVGLSFGGLAWIQHWILRLILYLEDLIPWNYVSFLDYAAQRIFLHKVGGGYIFIHRYLLEHFAKMSETEKDRN